jgi:hypothetical protein
MTDFLMEQVALRNPGDMSLSHYYPGSVKFKTTSRGELPWWLEFLFKWVIWALDELSIRAS